MPLSKNKIKLIRSLEQKKFRRQERAFVAEGHKSVGDLLAEGCRPRLVVSTADWQPRMELPEGTEHIVVTEEELRKASLLQHPQQVLGVFGLPDQSALPAAGRLRRDLCLCLDGVQDPGNLGTIIRTADWFGIRDIVCSPATADAYNPKVVQATMGSIARVHVAYADLGAWLRGMPEDIPVYGTVLDGDGIYGAGLSGGGIIVMGNEGNGISPEILPRLTRRLLIPPYPAGNKTAESLNVSVATAIICSEFRRNG